MAVQVVIWTVIALILGFSVNWVVAYSFFIGVLVMLAPQLYFVIHAFRYSGAQHAPHVVGALYRGEVGKFLITAVMFAFVFSVVKPLDVVVLFSSYIAASILNMILVFVAIRR